MATVAFHLRPSLRCGLHKGSIFIRIIHNRKIKTLTTNYRLFPYEWDKVRHCLVLPENDPMRRKRLTVIESCMQADLQRLNKIITLLEKRPNYTTDDIASRFYISPAENMISSYTKELSKKMMQNGHLRTARAYRTVTKGLIAFNNGQDVLLEQININLINRYEAYLRDNRKNGNTVAFYIRHLKAIYRKAVKEEVILPAYTEPFKHTFNQMTGNSPHVFPVIKSLQKESLRYIGHTIP